MHEYAAQRPFGPSKFLHHVIIPLGVAEPVQHDAHSLGGVGLVPAGRDDVLRNVEPEVELRVCVGDVTKL